MARISQILGSVISAFSLGNIGPDEAPTSRAVVRSDARPTNLQPNPGPNLS